MRTNASLRILVADTLITWGPVTVSSVNDNAASDSHLWRLAAGLHDVTVRVFRPDR
jgi:hypothetical protein